ncbi:MAG: TylF/MycF/NovP-related O-methyltransferase [Casimicrobiaceae bacterium]
MTTTIDDYLPAVPWVEDRDRKGRSPRDGYVRGWGLQFAGLRDLVRADPVYREAVVLAEGRSVMAEDNRLNLFLLLRFFLPRLPFGHVAEFGAYRAGNSMFMARVLQRTLPGAKVYAFDTFAGMPGTDISIDAHRPGDFFDVDLAELRSTATANGLDNLEFIDGLFEVTATPYLANTGPIALAHIDSDIYSGIAAAYDAVKPHMVPGGYYVFDDATVASCLGATEAVEELVIRRDHLHAEQIFPQFVFRAAKP